MTFTQASENVAIYCLAKNDWKLEQASDNYFQNPVEYDTAKISSHLSYSVDKRKLEAMYNRYRGNIYFLLKFVGTYYLLFCNVKLFCETLIVSS